MTVRLEQAENQATLTVRDNGLGLPQGFDPELGATLGLQLVWSLADQLHGVAEASNDGGAVFTVRFPLG
ncbi:ATP-binding protein [Humidesulfovibrio sp.]